MLDDLALLLDRVPPQAIKDGYLSAVLEENVLGKPTRTTRQRSAKRLTELYSLDSSCPLFRLAPPLLERRSRLDDQCWLF